MIRYLLIVISILLLLIALVTDKWQTLSMNKSDIYTDIGLWKTCSVLENGDKTCHVTELDTENDWGLFGIRSLAISTIIGLIIVCILLYKKSSKERVTIMLGMSTIAACLVPFLYSVYLENYFSQGFDDKMYSKYNYSFFLQSTGALLLLIAGYFNSH